MDSVDEYIEGLYEETPEKIKATRRILQLAKIPGNMSTLVQNGKRIISKHIQLCE